MLAVPNHIAHWRAQIFAHLLLAVFVLGLLTAIPSVLLAASEGLWSVVVLDSGAVLWIGAIWRLKQLAYSTRVTHFLGVAYIVGAGLLLKVGPVSQIYLLAIPVLAALLLGLRPALWALLITSVSVLLLGFQYDAMPHPGGQPFQGHGWFKAGIVALNFLFMASLLTLSSAVLLRHLEQSQDELRATARSLEDGKDHLHALNAELHLALEEQHRAQQDIHRLAFFDGLTGLPNRRLLMDRIDALLAGAHAGADGSGAVMFIDLDRFKFINDARGHATGDTLLRTAAERLSQLMRDGDTVARIGGDEFVVLLAQLPAGQAEAGRAALAAAEKVRAALAREFDIEDQRYQSSASIGVTLLAPRGTSGAGRSAADLLREADMAMYRAKADGRNGIAFFEHGMRTDIERRLTMERDLASALDERRLQMHFQPQVDAHGRTVGAELLMRWPLADGSMVPPAVFIPVAEEAGLMPRLGQWALEQACDAVLLLARAGHRLPLSVNVSPAQFRQPDFVDQLRGALARSGAPAAMLILEVTEGLLIDKMDDTVARMRELAALGLRFSIDDFGTGYSSLAYLKNMPLYELKIDRSFIIDTPHDASSAALVQSILSMAGHLGLRVVAEGVETREQASFLIAHQCACMQGYLFARPAPLAALLAHLDAATVSPA